MQTQIGEVSAISSFFRILIAEDDPMTRQTIELLIRKHPGFINAEILQAEDGWSALIQIRKACPSLLLLDMEMPGMTGLELIDQLIKFQIHLNIIVISGYDSFEYTHKAIQYGIKDYLLKPINKAQFFSQLDNIQHELKAIDSESPKDGSMLIVKEYIDSNYFMDLSLNSLAKLFHFSREHLSREFKKQNGNNITKYINEVRLEHAKILLQNGLSITQCCSAVGFHDDSYFIKLFRKKYGESPKRSLR